MFSNVCKKKYVVLLIFVVFLGGEGGLWQKCILYAIDISDFFLMYSNKENKPSMSTYCECSKQVELVCTKYFPHNNSRY